MPEPNFTDAALLLVGHGSTDHAASSAPVYQHAAELRRRRVFALVVECFLKQEPPLAEVLRTVAASRVFVVPLFVSQGYFTEQFIPAALGLSPTAGPGFPRRQLRGTQTLHYCGPVGTHARMTEVVLDQAHAIVEKHPFPHAPKPANTALVLAGHGTTVNENSRKAIEDQARHIAALGRYGEVHAVFLEESPGVADCYALVRARNIVIVPFFISDGLHVTEDIPILLGEPRKVVEERLRLGQPTWRNPTERHGKRVWYSASIGSDPGIAEVILERVREAASAKDQERGPLPARIQPCPDTRAVKSSAHEPRSESP